MELRPNAAPRRDSSIVPAPPPSERWFLRVQGVTLGPFALEDVRAGIQSGEFEAADKICSSGEPGWKTLAEHPRFALPSAPALSLKSGNIPSPPPPRVLRVKAPPTPAVAPEPAAAEVAAPIPEPPPAPAVVEAPPEAPAAPAAMAHATIISAEPIPAPVAEPAMPLATPSETISPSSAIPSRPDYTPIFIAAPDSWKETKKNSAKDRTIKIELKLPEKPLRFFALLLLVIAVAVAAGVGGGSLVGPNKTRDLKDFRLPDPSSPTLTPQETGDPIPSLKAPTRPQRE